MIDQLIADYASIVKQAARRYSYVYDRDDLESVGYLVIIQNSTLPKDELIRKIYSRIRNYGRKQRRKSATGGNLPNQGYIPTDTTILNDVLACCVTDYERMVIGYKAQGWSGQEVSLLCSLSRAEVHNICGRVKKRYLGEAVLSLGDILKIVVEESDLPEAIDIASDPNCDPLQLLRSLRHWKHPKAKIIREELRNYGETKRIQSLAS